MKHLTAEVFKAIADHLAGIAREKSLSGAFGMAELFSNEPSVAHFCRINRDNYLRIGVQDKRDINYLAVAFAKLAGVVAHGEDSGTERQIFGEVPYKGGHLSKNGKVIYFFSGASAEEDLELMMIAEQFHESL